jgi:hypothetical protein
LAFEGGAVGVCGPAAELLNEESRHQISQRSKAEVIQNTETAPSNPSKGI